MNLSTRHRRTKKRFVSAGRLLAAMAFVLAGAVTMAATAVSQPAGGSHLPDIRIVSDPSGEKLKVNGMDFMVFGMNWGYMPIGENYLYSLWAQPDDVIEAALAREMPLLLDMGVNTIRQYVGIPPRWVKYIYEKYGIFTILNHPMARYGFTLDGVWTASVDYADPRLREAVIAEIVAMVEEFKDTPGVLMWLLGNENNYGLSWTSFEAEALPEGEQNAARARKLYSLFEEVTVAVKQVDTNRPVAIANGDVQYIDIIAEECKSLDVFGSNCYRGISARDLFQVVEDKLGVPVMFTEFGADAFNAKEMREDQMMQAKYLIGQWQEIYEQSYGKGRVGNAIGGLIFQWSDGWWKFGQDSRLDIHDTNASWPNGGYVEDYVEGENNMNEEWWGITAKGPSDHRGLYHVYPRAAYYALRQAFELDPYAPTTDLAAIRAYFARIQPAPAELEARGNTASLMAGSSERVRVSGVRLEFETYNTGGSNISTPDDAAATSDNYPAFQGFDQMQSYYVDFEAKPTDAVTGTLSLNIVGDVPINPIDEIFYEARRLRLVSGEETFELDRVAVYQAAVAWDDRWFRLDGFYRVGHLHWMYEGDFFGLYRDAYYGENIDIYNGLAPVGVEIAGKKWFNGLKIAFGEQLWWGANPTIMAKYTRPIGDYQVTAVAQEDIADQGRVASSIAVPRPQTRKVSLQAAGRVGPIGVEIGGLWSGDTKVDDGFQNIIGSEIKQDSVRNEDTFGAKIKLTYERGPLRWYGQAAHMGLVADGGPTPIVTYTGWHLKDSGLGNQQNFMTGITYNVGNFQFGPNFLWQKPIVAPIPGDVPSPGRPRNILDDPFAVRENREMTAVEVLITYDETPATWFWQWDNDAREDARLAWSLGWIYRDMPTTMDASIGILADGVTPFAFPGATPPRTLWEVHGRFVSNFRPGARLVGHVYGGEGEPKGEDTRLVERFGADARLTIGGVALAGYAKFDDWGPYDYHRDFNLTFPVQLMGDVSYSLGAPRWFDYAQTRMGVMVKWRTLDEHSPRYCPDVIPDPSGTLVCDPTAPGDDGREWEIRTYLHLSL